MAQKQVGSFYKACWQKIKTGAVKLVKSPEFYIYLVAAVIYLPWFLPNLCDIAPWDETYYVLSGRNLLSGQVPDLASGPLLSLFYLICTLPFLNAPFWLVHANSLGRFLLFTAVFMGTWQVAKVLKDRFQPVILFGFLFVSPFLTQNFEYPADLLFAALSAIAFSQAVRFVKTKRLSFVWRSSFWLGLGMLTRGDALIIILALTVFVFLALSIGYVLVRGALTGDFATGMSQRSYTAFEQGQEVALGEAGSRFGAPTESYYVARDLFGTPEENEYSVFKAIARNPQAYLIRFWAVIKTLPGLFLTAYNRRFAVPLLLFAIRGMIVLIEEKKLPLGLLAIVWVLPLSAGVARTLVRVGYFRLFYFVLFSLAIIGMKALLKSMKVNREALVWAGLLGLILLLAFLFKKDGIQMSATIFLCWLLLAYLISKHSVKYPGWKYMAMLLLLASAYLLRTGELIYRPRQLGADPREEAALVLRDVTEENDSVLTCTPSVVFLADRQVANFCSSDIPDFEDSEAFIDWMRSQSFDAVYLDRESPGIFQEMVLDQRGKALRQVFMSEGSEAYIFLLSQTD